MPFISPKGLHNQLVQSNPFHFKSINRPSLRWKRNAHLSFLFTGFLEAAAVQQRLTVSVALVKSNLPALKVRQYKIRVKLRREKKCVATSIYSGTKSVRNYHKLSFKPRFKRFDFPRISTHRQRVCNRWHLANLFSFWRSSCHNSERPRSPVPPPMAKRKTALWEM